MINLIESPQRSDIKATYVVSGDILTITINEVAEVFDFSSFPDGVAEEITPDILPVNPIISVSKLDGVIDIAVIRFYSEEEKTLFEEGENNEN